MEKVYSKINSHFNISSLKKESFGIFKDPSLISAYHKSLNNYEASLIALPDLAKKMGIGRNY